MIDHLLSQRILGLTIAFSGLMLPTFSQVDENIFPNGRNTLVESDRESTMGKGNHL